MMKRQSEHDKHCEQLLPWYINGTLGAEEKAEVEQYLHGNQARQSEFQFLGNLRESIQSHSVQPPGELGLRRLLRDIDRQERDSAPQRSWWRTAAIAASVLAMVQAAVILNQSQDEFSPSYQPLSGETQMAGSTAVVLQIQFSQGASIGDINTLLGAKRAQIVSGPSKSGLYRISVDLNDTHAANTLIEELEQDPIVTHVAEE